MCLFKQYLCVLCPLLTLWGKKNSFPYVEMSSNLTGSVSVFSLLFVPATLFIRTILSFKVA